MSMNDAFAPPEVDDMAAAKPVGQLGDMPWPALKKLYYRSCNISGVAGLIIFSMVVVIIMLVSLSQRGPLASIELHPLFIAVMILNVVTVIGLIQRSSWGRVVGIITCSLMILAFALSLANGRPNILQLLVGLMGVSACANGKFLFGPQRMLHRDIKAAFKQAKRDRRAARRGELEN